MWTGVKSFYIDYFDYLTEFNNQYFIFYRKIYSTILFYLKIQNSYSVKSIRKDLSSAEKENTRT